MISRLFGHIKGRENHFRALLQQGTIHQFPRNIHRAIHRNDFWLYRLRSQLLTESSIKFGLKRNVHGIAPAPAPLPARLATSPTDPPPFQPLNACTNPPKRTNRDFDNFAPAHTPLPAPLATSPTGPPPIVHPLTRVEIHLKEDGSFRMCDPKFDKGTTVFAFTFDDGIMVSLDHSKSAKNLVVLNSHMIATISGGSEFLLEDLQKMCCEKEQREGRKTSVAEALKWLADTLLSFKEKLPVGILIAVWNELEHGLYRMNGEGKLVKDDIVATGSGSFGSFVLEDQFKSNMTVAEAAALVKSAICIAAYRAPHSGDIFSVYHLGRNGCVKVLEGDIEKWQKENLKSTKWKYVVIGPGW